MEMVAKCAPCLGGLCRHQECTTPPDSAMDAVTAVAGTPCCEPHPELVRAQQPAPAQEMEAAAILGAFPDGSYLAGELMIGGR